MSYTDLIDHIKTLTEEGHKVISGEYSKLLSSVASDLEKLANLAVEYKSNVEKAKAEWKAVNAEVKKLTESKERLKEREKEVDKKVQKVNKQEEDLAELHKILENKRKMLDSREQELKTTARRMV